MLRCPALKVCGRITRTVELESSAGRGILGRSPGRSSMHHHHQEPGSPLVSWVERLAAPLTDRFSRRRVRHWCRRQGLSAAAVARTPSCSRDRARGRCSHERYRIQVLDEEGRQRAGYLVFRRWWSGAQRARSWDDARRRGAIRATRPRRRRATALRHRRVLTGEDPVERALHPPRIAAPPGQHGDVLLAVHANVVGGATMPERSDTPTAACRSPHRTHGSSGRWCRR